MILIDSNKLVQCSAPIIDRVIIDGESKIKIYFNPSDLSQFYYIADNYGPDSEIIDGVEVPSIAVKYQYIDGQFVPYNPPIV